MLRVTRQVTQITMETPGCGQASLRPLRLSAEGAGSSRPLLCQFNTNWPHGTLGCQPPLGQRQASGPFRGRQEALSSCVPPPNTSGLEPALTAHNLGASISSSENWQHPLHQQVRTRRERTKRAPHLASSRCPMPAPPFLSAPGLPWGSQFCWL